MRGVFDETDLEQNPQRRDTELTLGPGMLLALFFGLMLLCGVCFGLGYSMGRRSAPVSAALAQPAAAPAPTAAAHPKPAASAQSPASAQQAAPQDSNTSPAPDGQAPGAAAALNAGSAPPLVKPALSQNNPAPPQPVPDQNLQSANAPAVSLMVQIAAVSHQEDADVLIGALRKRGYAVSVHRQPADGLLHVQVGPFTSREEASRWRLKLLNDGYNAVVQ